MKEKKILIRHREEIRRRSYSYSTEKIYSQWIFRFVRFHYYMYPKSLNEVDVVKYLNYLANDLNVVVSTSNFRLTHSKLPLTLISVSWT